MSWRIAQLLTGMLRIAGLLATLLTAHASFANSPPESRAPQIPDPISEALCGRGPAGTKLQLAKSLGSSDALPAAWRKTTTDELNLWLQAKPCAEPTPEESATFEFRKSMLENLDVDPQKVEAIAAIGASLLSLADKEPKSDDGSKTDLWRAQAECSGCGTLREAAIKVKSSAAAWRRRSTTGSRLGPLHDYIKTNELLIGELCAATPGPGASKEMKDRFAYYTWTAGGAWLLEVGAWFETAPMVERCKRQ